jgi:hypothetical protein
MAEEPAEQEEPAPARPGRHGNTRRKTTAWIIRLWGPTRGVLELLELTASGQSEGPYRVAIRALIHTGDLAVLYLRTRDR